MKTKPPCPLCKDKGYTIRWVDSVVNYISCTCPIGLQFAIQFRSPEKEPTDENP